MNPFKCTIPVDVYVAHLQTISNKTITFREFVPAGVKFDICNFHDTVKRKMQRVRHVRVHTESFCKCMIDWHLALPPSEELPRKAIRAGVNTKKTFCRGCQSWFNQLCLWPEHLTVSSEGERIRMNFPSQEKNVKDCLYCSFGGLHKEISYTDEELFLEPKFVSILIDEIVHKNQ